MRVEIIQGGSLHLLKEAINDFLADKALQDIQIKDLKGKLTAIICYYEVI